MKHAWLLSLEQRGVFQKSRQGEKASAAGTFRGCVTHPHAGSLLTQCSVGESSNDNKVGLDGASVKRKIKL